MNKLPSNVPHQTSVIFFVATPKKGSCHVVVSNKLLDCDWEETNNAQFQMFVHLPQLF